MADPTGASLAAVSDAPRNEVSTRRVALGLSYDGSGFHGFAAQPGQRTVAGELARAIHRMSGTMPLVVCAGRTDAGVHATAQVVHVDLDSEFVDGRLGAAELRAGDEITRLADSLSSQLGSEVAVWRAILAPDGFDARRSAIARRYRYDIDNGPRPDPLRRTVAWHVEAPLDLAAMRLAADAVLGEHDFAAFCRRPPGDPIGPIFRNVHEARWTLTRPGRLCFEIESNAFCHQMARSIVGALVAAGRGTMRPSDVLALLQSKSRAGAPNPAPPGGLCLVAVRYPPELSGVWA